MVFLANCSQLDFLSQTSFYGLENFQGVPFVLEHIVAKCELCGFQKKHDDKETREYFVLRHQRETELPTHLGYLGCSGTSGPQIDHGQGS